MFDLVHRICSYCWPTLSPTLCFSIIVSQSLSFVFLMLLSYIYFLLSYVSLANLTLLCHSRLVPPLISTSVPSFFLLFILIPLFTLFAFYIPRSHLWPVDWMKQVLFIVGGVPTGPFSLPHMPTSWFLNLFLQFPTNYSYTKVLQIQVCAKKVNCNQQYLLHIFYFCPKRINCWLMWA